MKFTALPLLGAYVVEPERRGDDRGFFARTFCVEEFAVHGLATHWVQCNMSFSAKVGTIRGLHFQRPPMAETKLVRCTSGAIFDVIVDLRLGSTTYGQWHGERLDEGNRNMICVPEGFAHGFQTLSDDVEMLYFHSAPYSAAHEGGLRWNDHELGIPWPMPVTDISVRDQGFPLLDELEPISV
jgi:dTDP-4-dehydrorhamnose 3,5-epimerase